MSAEEDNLDIDIYGDGGGGGDDYQDETGQVAEGTQQQQDTLAVNAEASTVSEPMQEIQLVENAADDHNQATPDTQQVESTSTSVQDAMPAPKQACAMQGTKRKEGPDDRPQDPGATGALFFSELHWWITDDDIRGWSNECDCEDELQEVTFSEHKVNGKSKG